MEDDDEPQSAFFATLAVFVVAYAISAAQFPSMLSTRVLANLLTDNAYLGVAAVGMTFVIISGGIDLSVGSVIAFTGVFLAVTIRAGLDPVLAIALVLIITTAFGAVMGALIHALETPAFIVTLAGMFFARGVCFLLTTDSVPIDHPTWSALTSLTWKIPSGGRFTLIAGIMIAATLAGIVLAHFTRFGTYVYGLGGNRTSAELMGVRWRGRRWRSTRCRACCPASPASCSRSTPPPAIRWPPPASNSTPSRRW